MSKISPCYRRSPLAGLLLAVLACGPALAAGFGEGSSLPLTDRVVDWIGFRDLTGERRDLFAYCLIFFALAFGYLTDLFFRDRGFGKLLNGVVGVVGVCLALFVIGPRAANLGGGLETIRFNLLVIAAGAGAALTLVVGAAIKGVVMRSLRLNLDRLHRAPPARPLKTETAFDPRISSALREKV